MKRHFVCAVLGVASILFCVSAICAREPGQRQGQIQPQPAASTVASLLESAHAVLAQLDGTLRLPGLKQPVEVLRDRWGIPHIYAKNQHDLFFAQGFVAAQDRLFQIDLWRRIAVGETAEIFGKDSLLRDRFARLTRYRGDMQAEWQSYAPDTQEIVTAFTAGINAGIDSMNDRLPIEFQLLGYKPGKWRPEDCLGRMALLPVALNLSREVARAELIAAVGVERARQLMPTDPQVDFAPVPGFSLEGIDKSVLAGYDAVTSPILVRPNPEPEGSNNWAVSGALSASGKPMLASDPHRSITLPSLRYLVHLHAPGWNVIGSGEPALPGVAIGHNERIAWGFTVVGTDQADLFVEETHPDDPYQYRVGNGWERMTVLRESARVKTDNAYETVELELAYTRHGPVIHEDRERRRAYALRWVGSEPGTAAYLASLAVDRAGNWSEFKQAAARWKTPSENIVYADVDGHIGWIAAALTPIRDGWEGLLPVPGASGKYRWRGFLKLEDLPQSYDPPSGYVITANQNILPPDYKQKIAFDWAEPYRFTRLDEQLSRRQKFTLRDFQQMQHDHVSNMAKDLLAVFKQVSIDDSDAAKYANWLHDWDANLDRNSQAAALYTLWRTELTKRFFGKDCPPALLEEVSRRASLPSMVKELQNPSTARFGEQPTAQRDLLVQTTFIAAIAEAKQRLGDDPKHWTLGKLQHVLFKHPLARLGDAHATAFNVGPFESGSDPFAPDQARFDRNFSRLHGPTYRHLFDLADWDQGMATSAPGQSGQPGSPHYADLAPLWDNGEYFPLLYSRAKVEEATRHRLVLEPTH